MFIENESTGEERKDIHSRHRFFTQIRPPVVVVVVVVDVVVFRLFLLVFRDFANRVTLFLSDAIFPFFFFFYVTLKIITV